jgi:predicted HTH transcriptional regulator
MSESQNIEYKSTWRDEYLKWICGFANANGGTIFIGKGDNGKTVGMANAKKLLEEIPNKVRDVLGIIVDVNFYKTKQGEYLKIVVEPYPNAANYKGQYHYRSGSTKQELKGAALDKFLLQKRGNRWDGVPIPKVSVKDLKQETFDFFKKRSVTNKRIAEENLSQDNAHLLENLQLIENGYLKLKKQLICFSRVYKDKMMIWNEGRLPGDWTVDNLLKSHSSRPYNPDIANAFFRSGYVESWGRGINKMTELCIVAGLPQPAYLVEGSDFWIEFKKDIYHKEYLIELELNERQLDALLFFKQKGEIISSEYVKRYNITDRTARRDLIALVEKNILLKEGDKKTSKYIFR